MHRAHRVTGPAQLGSPLAVEKRNKLLTNGPGSSEVNLNWTGTHDRPSRYRNETHRWLQGNDSEAGFGVGEAGLEEEEA
jgi:hypothetical protein